MTYRASLGTRGELRRIAAEAESVTIDHVRPWIRKVQPCRLAPHVIVPQWIRLEKPVKPKPPPPLVSQSHIASSELVEEILESATAKKFRRGRGRRGRPRKRTESAANPDLKPADENVTSGQVVSEPLSAALGVPEFGNKATKEAEAGNEATREAEMSTVLLASDENMMDTEKAEVSVPAENHRPNVDEAAGKEIAKESEAGNEAEKEAEMSTVLPVSDENAMDTEEANVFVPGEHLQPNVDEGARNDIAKESKAGNETEKEAEMSTMLPVSDENAMDTEEANVFVPGEHLQPNVDEGARNDISKESKAGNETEKEAEMSTVLPVSDENAMDTEEASVFVPAEHLQTNVDERGRNEAAKESEDGNEMKKESGAGNEMEKEAGSTNEVEKEAGTGNEMQKEAGTGNEMQKEAGTENGIQKEAGTGNEVEEEAGAGNEIEEEAGTGNEIEKEAAAGNEMQKEAGTGNEIQREAGTGDEIERKAGTGIETEKEAGAGNEAEKEAEMSAVLSASGENAMVTEKAKVSVPGENHRPNVDESNDEAVEKEQQGTNDASTEDIRSTAEPHLEKPNSLNPKENPLVPGQDAGDPAVPNPLKD